MKSGNRIIWLDLVRIMAIYLVILVHAISSAPKTIFPFSTALSSISVPLFVVLSGALLLNKTESNLDFYKKRFLRIFLPWLTWTIAYTATAIFQNPSIDLPSFLKLFSSIFTSFWFLPMITTLYILTPAMRIFMRHAKNKEIGFVILVWFISVSFLPYYKNTAAFPLSVDNGLVRQFIDYIGLFLIGGLFMRVKYIKTQPALIGLLFGFVWVFTDYYFRVFNNTASLYNSFSFIFPGIIICATSLFLIIKSYENKLSSLSKKAKSIIISVSNASLGIYFIHQLVFDFFLKTTGKSYVFNASFAIEWINSIAIFLISYIVIWGLSKITLIKRFIT